MENVILLADPESYAWDFALKIEDYIKKEKNENVPLQEVSLKHFRNGEEDMYISTNVRKKERLFCYATHGLFTEGTKALAEKFDVLMTSNTHYINGDKLKDVDLIDVTPLFAEAIYRAQKGISISSLFEQ